MAYERAMAQSSYYAQSDIIIRPHEPHPDCPDTLACLPDTNGRPQHTLPVILRCAILGSPKRRLTIREIYAAMEKKYPYYKTAGPAWKVCPLPCPPYSREPISPPLFPLSKQSVRHHLSLNRLFERQPRPATDPGFGSYWTVNLDAPPGTKRPRKRGRAKEAQAQATMHALVPNDAPYRPLPPDPRAPHMHPHKGTPHIGSLRPVDAHSFTSSGIRAGAFDDDDDDEDEMAWENGAPIVMSDDDYDSEERSPYNYNPPASASSTNTTASFSNHNHPPHPPLRQPGRPTNGNFSPTYNHHPPPPPPPLPSSQDPAVDRLKQEIESLKRQASEHEHLTLRLSNQLTRVETESLRVKQALKMAESRLEDEQRRRIEAERAADEEARMRRQAEDGFRALQMQASRAMPGLTSPL